MKKRALTVLLTAAMTMSLFAGCGNGDTESGSQAGDSSQSDGGIQSQESAGEGEADSGDEAPEESAETPADDLSQHREITAWLYADDYKYFGSKDEAPLVKYLNEKFNCNVTFQQPPVGSETDSFNMMLGSNEYTDVMELTYSIDSPATLYEDGVIIDLAPYLETYMPNYYAWLNDPAHEEERKALYDDEGHCFVITAEAGDGTPSLVWGGMVYRKDIIDTMTGGSPAYPSGNPEPVTIADWEYMLELMKQYFQAANLTDSAALILPYQGYFPTGELLNGFGVGGGFYVEDGQVHYGPTEQGFYNYLAKMREWYEKGYIYQDFASRTNDLFYQPNTALTWGGSAGVFFGGYWQLEERMSIPEYDLNMMVKALPSPLDAEHGENGDFGTIGMDGGFSGVNGVWGVSTACSMENMIRFMTWSDYMFTEEGSMMKKYGFTGELAAADSLYQELGLEKGAYWFDEEGNFVQDERLINGEIEPTGLGGNRLPGMNANKWGYANTEQSWLDADQVWASLGKENNYPNGATLTAQESDSFTDYYNKFQDYSNSMVSKFIMGTEELTEESFAAYVAQMNEYGVEEAVKMYQAAYDRYMSR